MVGFLLAVATVFAANLIFRTERGAAAAEVTQANMTRIRDAVVAYVALNQRLPCPAAPTDGRAAPETATTIISPTVLPQAALSHGAPWA